MREIRVKLTEAEFQLLERARLAYAEQTGAKPRTRNEFVRDGIAEMCYLAGFDFNFESTHDHVEIEESRPKAHYSL